MSPAPRAARLPTHSPNRTRPSNTYVAGPPCTNLLGRHPDPTRGQQPHQDQPPPTHPPCPLAPLQAGLAALSETEKALLDAAAAGTRSWEEARALVGDEYVRIWQVRGVSGCAGGGGGKGAHALTCVSFGQGPLRLS